MGYDEIWNIFDKYEPDTSSTSKNHPWTVYDFWNGWMTNSYGDYTEVKSILADRGIYVGSTVKITEPNGGGWYKGNITVRATEDISGSTSSVEFQYSLDSTNGIDGAWNAIGSDNNEADGFSLQWNTVNIVDPSVWIRARGFDGREWGNWDSSDSSFGIDNSNPIVSISSPLTDSTLTSTSVTVYLSGSDTGSGINRFEIQLDDGGWINKGLDTVHIFSSVSYGTHTVYVKAIDKIGHSKTTNVDFTVKQSLPDLSISSSDITFLKVGGN